MSADQWRVPDDWRVTVPALPPGFAFAEPAVDWNRDVVVAVLTAAFVTLAGQVVGLIWSATTPQLSLRQVVAGSEAPFKDQVGADGRFLLVGAAAGVVCALVVVALRQFGPGAVVGLAVGGLLGAIVANHVGVVAQHDASVAAFRHLGLPRTPRLVGLLGFRVRATGVLTAWPIAAVVVHGLVVALRPHTR